MLSHLVLIVILHYIQVVNMCDTLLLEAIDCLSGLILKSLHLRKLCFQKTL